MSKSFHWAKVELLGLLSVSLAILAFPNPVRAAGTTLPSIELVMTGSSSSGSDQVWLRVLGQPAGVANDCVYGNWSLLYTDGTAGVSSDKALSLLLTAKVASRPVFIEYDLAANPSDFFGFGISRCRILRIAMM